MEKYIGKTGLIFFAFLLFINPCLSAKTCYVKTTGNDDDTGTSWGVAFGTIKKALNIAQPHDSIWVAEGTYKEGETLNIPENIGLFGGFSGNELSLEERNVWLRPTIIDGERNFVCAVNYGTLNGFHITRGESTESGGGVKNYGVLSNSKIYDNNGLNIFRGGGISNIEGMVENCVVYGNQAVDYGGGMYNSGLVINCIIYNNTSKIGGGVCNEEGTILNCTIYKNNTEQGYAGGIYNEHGTVINTISWNNEKEDFWRYDNTNNPSYSCYGEALELDGNIRENPLFVNTSGDPETWDLRLQNGSPCIGAGSVEDSPPYDIFGNPRPGEDDRACIGAYEAPPDYASSKTLALKILYVNKEGNDTTGDSWENAFASIAKALSIPAGDDIFEIWVAEGIYQEGKTIDVPKRVRLYGGFCGNEIRLSERHITNHPTIIDGNDSYRCVSNYGYVDGFYITRGQALYFEGGGVGNELSVVNQCFIHGNYSGTYGGGIYNDGGIIKNTEIFDNVADLGGAGVFNGGGILSNCSIHDNSYTGDSCPGGGIYNILGTILNCDIYLNMSSNGGGIFNVGGIILNCILYNNFSYYSGGGISTQAFSGSEFYYNAGLIENCTVFNNSSEYETGGIDGWDSIINNCVIWSNKNADISPIYGKVYYSCFRESTGLNGNIDSDPLFMNAQGPIYTWDFRLQRNSPCTDAGNPDEIFNDGCIPPGRGTSRNDMGAFGGPHNCAWLEDLTTGDIINIILGRDELSSPTLSYIDQNKDGSLDVSDLVSLMLFK